MPHLVLSSPQTKLNITYHNHDHTILFRFTDNNVTINNGGPKEMAETSVRNGMEFDYFISEVTSSDTGRTEGSPRAEAEWTRPSVTHSDVEIRRAGTALCKGDGRGVEGGSRSVSSACAAVERYRQSR